MAANSILQAIAFEQHQKQLQFQQQQQQLQQHLFQDDHADDGEFGGAMQRKRKTSCRTGISLSTEQKLQLIDYIHQRPQLWDSNSDGFRSNQTRQSAFNDVAAKLSDNTEAFSRIQIQEEWGKLRYCFTRIVKKLLEEGNGQIEEAQIATISWPYWKSMEFLLPGVRAQLAHQSASTESEGQQEAQAGSPGKESVASTTIAAQTTTKPRKKRSIRKASNAGPLMSHEPSTMGNVNTDLPGQAALAMSPQELLLANFSALNNSTNFLNQLQQQQQLNLNNRTIGIQQQQRRKSMDCDYGSGASSYDVTMGGGGDLSSVLNNVGSMSTAELVAALGDIKTTTTASAQNNHSSSNIDLFLQQSKQRKVSSELETLIQPTIGARREEEQLAALSATRPLSREFSRVGATQSMSLSGGEQRPQPSLSNDTVVADRWTEPRRDSSEPDADSGPDIAESFGRCIVQQMRSIARKSPTLGVQLRRELIDLCCKFEMRACAQENGHV